MNPAPAGEGDLVAALAAIDAVNADDPNTLVFEGEVRPKEQLHAELMTAWVRRLDPAADDAQLIAARAHHLRRWVSPRTDHPEGRAGYLRWRTELRARHAAEVGEIMRGCGYDEASVERVQKIVRKEGLRSDPAVQVHEDALCLVFLQTQLDDLGERLGEERSIEVLRKTLRKMSDAGRREALAIDLSPAGAALLAAALEAS